MKKYVLIFIGALLLLATPLSTDAAAKPTVDKLVSDALAASTKLANVSDINKKGTGRNLPYTELNDAKKKRTTATKAVNTLSSSKKKKYKTTLATIDANISKGIIYTDAVKSGLALEAETTALKAELAKGSSLKKAETLYNQLATDIPKKSRNIYKTSGKSTREKIVTLYIKPAQAALAGSYPVVVFKSVNLLDSYAKQATGKEAAMATEWKRAIVHVDLISQATFKADLQARLTAFAKALPEATANHSSLKPHLEAGLQFLTLDQLIQPGKGDKRIPELEQAVTTYITSLASSDKTNFNAKKNRLLAKMNLSVLEVKKLLTAAARAEGIPPEIVKAIALQENGQLQQFKNGNVFESDDHGYGIMQVTSDLDGSPLDFDKVKYDTKYNIEAGVKILAKKWSLPNLPTINNGEKNIIENWYFAIWGYNGLSKWNDPNTPGRTPYQTSVLQYVSTRMFVSPYVLSKTDFVVWPYSNDSTYTTFAPSQQIKTPKKTGSTQLYKLNDRITLRADSNFRSAATNVGNTPTLLKKGTVVQVLSAAPIEDISPTNFYTWYKVKVVSTNKTGYIASQNMN